MPVTAQEHYAIHNSQGDKAAAAEFGLIAESNGIHTFIQIPK